MNSILSGFFSAATILSALTLLITKLWESLTTPLVAGLTGFDFLSLTVAAFVTIQLLVFRSAEPKGTKRSLAGQNLSYRRARL